MKVTLNRDIFLQELATVQRAISGKTTIQILTGVKIVLTTDGISLTGSNGDISIETYIPSTDPKAEMIINQTGAVVLPARFFAEIIRKLPDSTFTMEMDEQLSVEITSGLAKFTLNGYNANEYPQLPVVEQNNLLQIPVRLLNQLINETTFAASVQENRPILTGVHFVLANGEFKAVATDSHRLSQRVLPMDQQMNHFDMVIPAKSLLELARSFRDEEEFVEISAIDNQVLFKTKRVSFYSRLLEGIYPDTDRLIPTSYETRVIFDGPQLLAAIERASLMSHEGSNTNNIVQLDIQNDEIVLHGNSPEIGNVEEHLSVEAIEGENLTISFNPDYMKAALKAIGTGNVAIQFMSSVRPFTLQPNEVDTDFIQLITPVRTN